MSKYISNEAYPGIDDKERAFPLTGYSPEEQYGMTLRDWFAGQALAGILARNLSDTVEIWAKVSYQLADAMLKIRKESK